MLKVEIDFKNQDISYKLKVKMLSKKDERFLCVCTSLKKSLLADFSVNMKCSKLLKNSHFFEVSKLKISSECIFGLSAIVITRNVKIINCKLFKRLPFSFGTIFKGNRLLCACPQGPFKYYMREGVTELCHHISHGIREGVWQIVTNEST